MTPVEQNPECTMAPQEPPLFAEPWQARAFALTLALHESGLFTWPEWTAALGYERSTSDQPDNPDTYYLDWLATLERLIVLKDAATADALTTTARRWQAAAAATPHGQTIALDAAPNNLAEDA